MSRESKHTSRDLANGSRISYTPSRRWARYAWRALEGMGSLSMSRRNKHYSKWPTWRTKECFRTTANREKHTVTCFWAISKALICLKMSSSIRIIQASSFTPGRGRNCWGISMHSTSARWTPTTSWATRTRTSSRYVCPLWFWTMHCEASARLSRGMQRIWSLCAEKPRDWTAGSRVYLIWSKISNQVVLRR